MYPGITLRKMHILGIVTLRGKCGMRAFCKCSCLCPDKNSTHLSEYLVYLTWKKEIENSSCFLQLFSGHEYQCKELIPSTFKSIKNDNEEKNGLCISFQSPTKLLYTSSDSTYRPK